MSQQRFLFEKKFDKPRGSAFLGEPMVMASFDSEDADLIEIVDEVLSSPSFSEEELAVARSVALEEGYQKGLSEAMAATEKQQNELLQRLLPQLEQLITAQENMPQQVFQQSVDLAGVMVKELFPHFAEEQAAAQFMELCRTAFDQAGEAPKLTLHCASDDRVLLETLINKTPAAQQFGGKIVFSVQSDFAPGDIRADWGEGGVERLSSRVRFKLEQILARHGAAQKQESDHE